MRPRPARLALRCLSALLALLAPVLAEGAAAETGKPQFPRDRLPGIYGGDDRELVDSTAWPWAAIGRINRASFRSRNLCSGTLVGPRLVLTAAHCLYDARQARFAHAREVFFLPGYGGGPAADAYQAAAIEIAPDYRPQGGPAARAHDWALVTLAGSPPIRPVPVHAPAPDAPAGPDRPVAIAGYARDRPHALSADRDCRLEAALSRPPLIGHRCDVTSGQSGGPVLVLDGADARLVAIVIGGEFAGQGAGAESLRSFVLSATAFAPAVRRALGQPN